MNQGKNCTTCRWHDSFSWDCLNSRSCYYTYTTDHEESCECWEERNELETEK